MGVGQTMDNSNVKRRADEILATQLFNIHRHTDRLFAILFVVQWVFAIGCAIFISPYTWLGEQSQIHIHVWAAFVMGGLLSACPIMMSIFHPGATSTRMVIVVAQMLYSGLLIHLTGGRIETHFHVFGSLAVMVFYRDWRVFVPATLVVAADHLLRGLFWPQSVFGVTTVALWRVLEHAGWVLFEDVFLIWGCQTSLRDLKAAATIQAKLEFTNCEFEERVNRRTKQLQEQTAGREREIEKRKELEMQLLQAQKLESVGQLAAGIAHEINTPMQFVSDNIDYLDDCSRRLFEVVDAYERNLSTDAHPKTWDARWAELGEVIHRNQFERIREQIPQALRESRDGIDRVINIVRAMKEFTHPGQQEKFGVDLNNAVSSTITISRNRWKYVADIELDLDPDLPTLRCVPAELNQVLLNLIVNAADAIIEKLGEDPDAKGKILVRTRQEDSDVVIEIADTGCGIPADIRNRIFDPFFTTKDVGKGTGQGLALCYNIIVNRHHGMIKVDSEPGKGTQFTVRLPQNSTGGANATTSERALAHASRASDW